MNVNTPMTIGQTVFTLINNRVCEATVKGIVIEVKGHLCYETGKQPRWETLTRISYTLENKNERSSDHSTGNCYPTKEELLASL